MAEHTINDVNIELLVEYIARGHSFNKHVEGLDLAPEMKGLNAFRETHNKLGEILGPDLKIETPDDFRHYLNQMIDHPQTKGYVHPSSGTVTIYNSAENVMLHANPFDKKLDFGTAYRYSSTEIDFLSFRRQAEAASGNRGVYQAFDNAQNPGSVRAGMDDLVTKIKTNPMLFAKTPEADPRFYKGLENADRAGRGPSDGVSNPTNNKIGHSDPYAKAYNIELPHKPGAADLLAEGGDKAKLAGTADNFDDALKNGDIVVDAAKTTKLGTATKVAGEVLETSVKVGGKVIKVVPIVGTLIGVGINTAEAAELNETLQTAIENGDISQEALLKYNTILAGHIAQGGDPSVIGGEAGIQLAYNAWADEYIKDNPALQAALQPSSLGLMIKNGAQYVGNAAVAVGGFAIEKAGDGLAATGHIIANTTDTLIDRFSGQEKALQEIYDVLPVLDQEDWEQNAHLSPTDVEKNPVLKNPPALAMAELKSRIVGAEDMIEGIRNGTQGPLGRASRQENIEYLEGYKERLEERFETTYEELKTHGMVAELDRFVVEEKERLEIQKSIDMTQKLEGPEFVQTMPQSTPPMMDIDNPYEVHPQGPGMRH